MSKHGIRLTVGMAMLGLVVAPAQAQFCFVDHVAKEEQGIGLYFVPESDVFVRISKADREVAITDRMYQQQGSQMHRVQPNALKPDAAVSEVVIFPGEQAFVSNGLHGSCSILPADAGNPAGVTLKASVSLPGLPSTTTMRFLPVGVHQEIGH